ncbi:MAG: alpha-1,4-glucan--maltose-1-phosphate maltosyltransferase [Proteobacteria bacterium]|nr:alpha-1,4-glucan--maltose-1-phosphate maltosyltransferase [Pseudomonadota bacterium]
MLPPDVVNRVWIEGVRPEIDGGRWPVKAILGDRFAVQADLVADGHDAVAGVVLYRFGQGGSWSETPLDLLVNDRFEASFDLTELGLWEYTLEAWVDDFATWRARLQKRIQAKQEVALELLVGADLVEQAAERAWRKHEGDHALLERFALDLRDPDTTTAKQAALGIGLSDLMAAYPDRSRGTRYDHVLQVRAERTKARFSAWYELFPRSTGSNGKHGSFADVEAVLPYVASMGFDVLYLPPIHPIGRSYRKGRNNALEAQPEDPGSPWAIGSSQGGHKAIHPELGTPTDFRHLVSAAREHDLEVAMDIAFQASPDHPYVKEHPEWFKQRPDGTIQYAENPPKKYQDIYPFDFGSRDWWPLWQELYSILIYWIEQGIRIFRVDNPHTKSLPFWAWCLSEIYKQHPDTVFLAEAFTRPKLMAALAKAGFSQSYTYFTWRNTRWEIQQYLEELTTTQLASYFRPNFWPNTPDILPEHLQHGGRPAFIARFVLAATLASNYGIYGPAFELMEHVARPGSEEYLDNEKYEIRSWNLREPKSLRSIITRINQTRKSQPALQDNRNLRFHPTDNNQLLCFSKHSDDCESRVLIVVNLDYRYKQSGWVELDPKLLGVEEDSAYEVHDVLTGARYPWRGGRNYVELDPQRVPAHLFIVQQPATSA